MPPPAPEGMRAGRTTLSGVRNDNSCVVKTGKIVGATYRRAGALWTFDYGHSS